MRHRYQPFYCEENIWHLCQEACFEGRRPRVVFISNAHQQVAMWGQRAGDEDRGGLIAWDYHVVLRAADPDEIWDLDTVFGCPLPTAQYLSVSFGALPPRFAPRFRVIDAAGFVQAFASDRSHMRTKTGRFKRPPPPWPLILPPGVEPSLARFIDVEQPFIGSVMDLDAFTALGDGAAETGC